jgi:hypothetical protein
MMGKPMADLKLKYVNEYVDRTGKLTALFPARVSTRAAPWRCRLRRIYGGIPRISWQRNIGQNIGQINRKPWPSHNRVLCLAPIPKPEGVKQTNLSRGT